MGRQRKGARYYTWTQEGLGIQKALERLIRAINYWRRAEEAVEKFRAWKRAMEKRGLRVNMEKTKIMICGEGMNRRRGRPLGRWKDRVKEYVNEREVRGTRLEWARRDSMDRERWRSICCGHPLGGCFRRERGVRAIN